MTGFRTVAQALAVPLALIVAVIAQLGVVNRLPLPGGTAPDLVLLVVTAVAVCAGPMAGMLAGFAGGLALDVAPPAGHLAGEYALVFCLVGYACGRARNAIINDAGEHPMLALLAVMALGTAAGEAGKAALGRLVSDPDVTNAAIRQVLPRAVIYDLLLCPFVFWLVSLMFRRPAPERAPRAELTHIATAFRAASAGAAPRLRLVGSTPSQVSPPGRPEPKLRFASGPSFPLSGTYAAFSPARPPLPGGRAAKLNFSPDGHGSPRPRQRTVPGNGWLRAQRPPGLAAPRRTAPPKGWLRVEWSAGTASLRRTSPGKGWLRPERPAGLAVPKRASPGKGWLRPARPAPLPKPKAPPRGWLRPAKPAPLPKRHSPGRGWIRPAKPVRRSSYGMSPSARWMRRSHSPWRDRRRLRELKAGRK